MNNLIIIGSGGHTRAVVSTLLETKTSKTLSIIDLNYKNKEEDILGVPVIGSLEKLEKYSIQSTSIFLSIGENKIRKSLINNPLIKKFEMINVIHPKALISPSSIIGQCNFIGPFAHIGPEVRLGSYNIVNSYANLEHETIVGDFNQFGPGSIVCGRCNIGNNIYIGANATVIHKLNINDNNIIGAGSVIISNILVKGKTFVGVPGKVL
jgi:sugar O-acyltransferase (sialic acid O-acetyltransferase NeuD family)